MTTEKVSARQLSVAVMVGGLSSAAAAAGSVDWRWSLATVPVGVVLGWLVLRRVGRKPLFQGIGGGILAVLYCGWAVILMTETFRRAGERVQLAAEGGENTAWAIVLLALPLLWMGWGKAEAFFRAVEIFWLAMVAVLAAILFLGVFRVDWQYVWKPAGTWREAMLSTGGVMATGLFVIPYIYKVPAEESNSRRGTTWLGGLGMLAAALGALTAGLLSPAVVRRLEGPAFFVAAGLLGDSARLEGLISALWLLSDLTLVGLLSRVWGKTRWPAAGVALAAILALTGAAAGIPWWLPPSGSLILTILTLIVPAGKGKIVVEY